MSNSVCKLCHGKIKYCGNTTNIQAHITRHHPELSDKAAEEAKPVASSKQRTLDTCFSKLPSSTEKAKRITESISHFICKDLHPSSYTLEPRYTIPSRRFFSDTALPKIYNEVKTEVRESLSNAEQVSLTCDAWTSQTTESYVTVTAHNITDELCMSSHVLQTRALHDSHTGANMAELLNNVAEEWGITENDPALVTDNACSLI